MRDLKLRDGWKVIGTVGSGGIEGLLEVTAARMVDGFGVVVTWKYVESTWIMVGWGDTECQTDYDEFIPNEPPFVVSSPGVSRIKMLMDDE